MTLEIKKALRAIREKHGHTQRQMSINAGYHKSYVGNIESGYTKPSRNFIRNIADAYSLTPEETNSLFDIARASGASLKTRPVTKVRTKDTGGKGNEFGWQFDVVAAKIQVDTEIESLRAEIQRINRETRALADELHLRKHGAEFFAPPAPKRVSGWWIAPALILGLGFWSIVAGLALGWI